MDGQTDVRTGGVAISPVPGPTAPAGDKKFGYVLYVGSRIFSVVLEVDFGVRIIRGADISRGIMVFMCGCISPLVSQRGGPINQGWNAVHTTVILCYHSPYHTQNN